MSLEFILGRAGTGKTRYCLDALRAAALAAPDGPPLVLLVPEQATFLMEQALLQSGLKGMMRAQVLSFKRLAWRVSLSAGGLAKPPLTDLGKQMLLRALVENRKADLHIFGQVAGRPGFVEKLARTISELRSYNLGPEHLAEQLAAMANQPTEQMALQEKLHDLALVMGDLTEYTRERFTDPDEYLTVLAERLPQSKVLDGAEVWVDSFTGYTPQEISALQAIFAAARQVHVTLCLDPAELPRKAGRRHKPTDLFHPTLDTYDQLTALADKAGVAVDRPVTLGEAGRFQNAPDLAHLERAFFRNGLLFQYTEPAASIALVSAQHRRQEAEAAAREVLRLAAAGMRYREISLVVRNLDAYGDLIETVFGEHSIPVFIDRRRPVAHHPLVELLRAALDVISQEWAYAAIFRYLKTDLIPIARHEADVLENYVLEHGIRGRRWHDGHPWRYVRRYTLEDETEEPGETEEAKLERINALRTKAAAELAAFQRRLGGGKSKARSVTAITTALFGLLDDLHVAKQLERWSAEAEAAHDLDAAREHEQVWQGVLELLDQMVESLGETEVDLAGYQQVLSAGLDGLRLGLIPPGLDQVVVGTVERSRSYGVRAALILGATERDFPPLPPEDVIFTDREREALDRSGMELGPTSKAQLFQEQFFTYVALTRSSERLWLSYPLASEDGRAVNPSPVVKRLLQVFPALQPEMLTDQADVSAIATPQQMAGALTRALRIHRSGYPLEPVWLDLYQWAVSEPDLRAVVAPTLAALTYEEQFQAATAPLGEELAHQLYGDTLVTSVSRLESFMLCPFCHFANYGLRLRERAQFQVTAPELGMFYHAAMSLFVRRLRQDGLLWENLTREEAFQRLNEIIDLLVPRLQSEILLSDSQHRYLLRGVRRTLQNSLTFLSEHIYRSEFRPLQVELPFGEGQEGGLPPVEILAPDGSLVKLRGRIDRVDQYRASDGSWFLRVLDYKSSEKSFDLGRFYLGMAIQLPLYLYAVLKHSTLLLPTDEPEGQPIIAHPGGALYFPIHDPIEKLILPHSAEEIYELRRKRFKARGLVNADPAIIRAMDATGLGLIQAGLKKDGEVRKGSLVASEEQFGQMFRHLEQVVGEVSQQMMSGQVSVTPVKLGSIIPCTTCAWRSVCQFDPLVKGQGCRTPRLMKGPDVWKELEEKGGEEHE